MAPAEEEKQEREKDRIYWQPLKAELEKLRHAEQQVSRRIKRIFDWTKLWVDPSAPSAETASLALLEAAHVGFVFSNPTCHLFTGEFSRFRHWDALPAQPRGKKQH